MGERGGDVNRGFKCGKKDGGRGNWNWWVLFLKQKSQPFNFTSEDLGAR